MLEKRLAQADSIKCYRQHDKSVNHGHDREHLSKSHRKPECPRAAIICYEVGREGSAGENNTDGDLARMVDNLPEVLSQVVDGATDGSGKKPQSPGTDRGNRGQPPEANSDGRNPQHADARLEYRPGMRLKRKVSVVHEC